jgi:phytol kinase
VAAGVLVMALGDGMAGLVGPLIRSPSWQVFNQRRSLAGTTAMALTSLAVLFGLSAAASAHGLAVPPAAAVAAIALGATLLEQLAIGGLDNLTVPLAVAWCWQGLTPG